MNTYLTLKLDTRRAKSDGTFPIIIRITHLRKTTSIATGFYVQKPDWDNRRGQVKYSYKGAYSVPHLNTLLLKELTRANSILNKLIDNGELNYLSIREIKERIVQKNKFESFFAFGESLVEELKQQNRLGTARSYDFLLKRLRKFNKGRDLKFNQLNYDFLKRLEHEHLSRGYSWNGLSTYTRTIRAIFNKAIRAGLIAREASPFLRYQIKQVPTAKRALPVKHLKSILVLELEPNSNLFHYRNYFLLSYMLYGMNFTDMAHLKIKNIIDDRLLYKRKKNGRAYDIKLTEPTLELIRPYIAGKSKDDYILPIINRKRPEGIYKDIEWARGRYNKGLKEIGTLCRIEQRLTSYVSRHSFATQAMLNNIPLEAISAMMGHSRINTTQIYLKNLPASVLDGYNEQLIRAI